MEITSDNDTRQTTTAVVSVRIPNGADGGLATEAERRLARADGVSDVTVDDLRGLDPGLSATVVTVSVTIESTGDLVGAAVSDALDEVTGVDIIVEGPD